MLLATSIAGAAPAEPYVYVSNYGDGTISVINTATNEVVATLSTGAGPKDVVVTQDGTKAYVTSLGTHSVQVINTATNTIIETIPIDSFPFFPYALAMTPDETKVYVSSCNWEEALTPGTVSVIDTAGNTVSTSLTVGAYPRDIAITPDGTKVYVANNFGRSVSVISTGTGTVTTIMMPIDPYGVAITPDGTRAYVTDFSGNMGVISTLDDSIVITTVADTPKNIAITPGGTRAYVVDNTAAGMPGEISVINLSSYDLITNIAVGFNPDSVAITPDGTRAYVTNAESNTVSVIDTGTNTVISTVAVGNQPSGLWITKAIPEVTLASSLNPSTYGQSVTYTATVTGTEGTPTGYILFSDGGTPIGSSIPLNGEGQATFTTSTSSVGAHQITASYGGNPLYMTATSPVVSQTINKADTALGLTSTTNPSVYGQAITITATVSALAPSTATPAGTLTFYDGATSLGTVTLSPSGTATLTTSTLQAGSHAFSATYGGNSNFNGCTGSLTGNPQVVNKANTSVALASVPNPGIYGQSVTFTATVSPDEPGDGTPTGTVTFYDGSASLGTATLSWGEATFTTSSLPVDTHMITASYAGDSNFNSSVSPARSQVINKADTTVGLVSSPDPSVYGQSATFTATVTAVAPGSGTPTGTVTFYDDVTPLGAVTLSGGAATLATSSLSAGAHSITAAYAGDGNFNAATSTVDSQTVEKAGTTMDVASSVNPGIYGQSVTFTATVSAVAPGSGTPAGTVEVYCDGSMIGTSTLSGGVATASTTGLSVGTHTITAIYAGSSNYNGCTGTLSGDQATNKADTVQTVTSSANPGVFGEPVTFTATVSAVAPGSGTPTGTITFYDGVTSLGTATLSGSGTATFTTSALSVASHTITTSYSGDTNFNISAGALTGNPEAVDKASTTLALTSSPDPSVYGQSITYTATISAVAPGSGTPTGTVSFFEDGTLAGTATTSGGTATFTTSATPVGSHTISATYGGNSNFNGSTGSLTGNPQVVNKASTTAVLTEDLNPSVYGQPVTFTATLSAVAPGSGTPTGTVTFLNGESTIGTATLSGGVATLTTGALPAGSHTITASYAGDDSFSGYTSAPEEQVVNKADTTQTSTMSVNPSVYGQQVTFTATVSITAPGSGTPTGTVTFLDGGSPIGTGTLAGGVATLTTSALPAGSHAINASYDGDSNFNSCSGSLTGNPLIVNQDSSGVALAASPEPGRTGQPVTLTATVTGAYGTPTGTVTFLDGGSSLGMATLSSGSATFTTSSLSVGTHTITASYAGNANYLGSTSSGLTEAILPKPPVANFTVNLTTGVLPVTLQFTDTSSGSPSSWEWNFGDGTPVSTEQNPAHAYGRAGTYTVTFTATNAGGSNTVQRSNLITVYVPTYGAPATVSMDEMYGRWTATPAPSPAPEATATPASTPVSEIKPTSVPAATPAGAATPTAVESQPQFGSLVIWIGGLAFLVIVISGVVYLVFFRK